jgi:hypothetical protein
MAHNNLVGVIRKNTYIKKNVQVNRIDFLYLLSVGGKFLSSYDFLL